MDEIMSTRPIETITAEIQRLKADAGNAIIAIGERLIEAKEQLPHGDWLPWLTEQVDFSERTARNFMRLAREWTNRQALVDLGASKALTLLALPEPEREEFIEAHDVPAMSTRELEQAIRERDAAQKAAADAETKLRELNGQLDVNMDALEEARTQNAEAAQTIGDLKARVKELENAPKNVYRDDAAIRKAAEDAKKAEAEVWKKKLKAAEDKLAAAKEAVKKTAEQAKSAGEDAEQKTAEQAKSAGDDAEQKTAAALEAAKKAAADAKAEAEALRRQLAMSDAAVTTFKVHFSAWQAAYTVMTGDLQAVDAETGGKLRAAIMAQIDAWRARA